MSRFPQGLTVLSIALLPLMADPLRLDPFEPHRAGLLGLLVATGLLAAGTARIPRWREHRVLLLAVGGWTAALVAASLFSLSPVRSLMGDLVSRMGLLTHFILIAGLLVGQWLDPRRWWRVFWLAGVAVAVFVLLEAAGILWDRPLTGRPPGPLGVATFTGGWLALIILWCGIPLVGEPWSGRVRSAWAGVALMVVACFATGSRGALIALAVGGGIAGLAGVADWPRSYWPTRFVRAGLVAAFALVMLAQTGPIGDWTSRLLERVGGSSLRFREVVWADARRITSDWPELVTVDGEPDRWAGIRPVVGYGLEMFEPPHRLYFDTDLNQLALDQRVDRAHNDLLDTLIISGGLGLGARVALWLAVIGTALTRLGYRLAPPAWLLPVGFAIAAWTTGGTLAPVTAPLAALLGVGLLLTTGRRTGETDVKGWIALAVASAHLIDVQLSFETVATAWPMWLTVGLLFGPSERAQSAESRSAAPTSLPVWAWAGVAGMALARWLPASGATGAGVGIVLASLLAAALAMQRPKARDVLIMGLFWLAGGAGARITTPDGAALWTLGALVLAAAVVTWDGGLPERLPRYRPALRWLALLPLLVLWVRDSSADGHARLGRRADTPEARATEYVTAAALRPWDDRLLALAGDAVTDVATRGSGGIVPEPLQMAARLLRDSAALHPFDAGLAYQLAIVAANQALLDGSTPEALATAERYFETAARLWPNEPAIWREWGRFTLELKAAPADAAPLLERALALDPGDSAARALLERAEA